MDRRVKTQGLKGKALGGARSVLWIVGNILGSSEVGRKVGMCRLRRKRGSIIPRFWTLRRRY